MRRHHAVDRRMQTRMCQAFDLVDVVVGRQFARTGLWKIAQAIDTLELLGIEPGVDRLPGRVDSKSGMRLITNTGPDANFVHAAGNGRGRRIARQDFSRHVVKRRHRHRLGRAGNQFVRPLEVVVLQGRLINLCREGRFIFGIRLRRIEMLRPLGKGRIEDVLPALARWIRIVPLAAAGREQSQ